jgi:hypothetical protein
MITQRDIDRLLESELARIAREKERLQSIREAEALEAARKRIAKRAAEAGRKQATATREHKVRPAITSHRHADGRVEVLDPDRPWTWSAEAAEIERRWAEVDRGRSRNGRIISAVCNEPVRLK